MKRLLLICLLLAGCMQQNPDISNVTLKYENGTSNYTNGTLNYTNATVNAASASLNATSAPSEVAAAYLCVVRRPGIDELVLFDGKRYAYEGRLNGNLASELVFTNDTLYFHVIPKVGNCEWASFNGQDRATVHKLGEVLILNYTEMAIRVPAQTCQKVPLVERVFSLPANPCTARELILQGLARGQN